MNIQKNTKHAARATQVERQVEKKAYTHDTDSLLQANRQGMCVRETEAIIGKAPRLGIRTPKCHAAVRPCRSFFERNMIWRLEQCIKMIIIIIYGVTLPSECG